MSFESGRPSLFFSFSRLSKRVCLFSFLFFFFFCLFVFLGLYLQPMEVLRLGVESELQLPAYTTAHSNVGSLTHWARPGIEPTSLWMLVRFANHWDTTGTPRLCLLRAGKTHTVFKRRLTKPSNFYRVKSLNINHSKTQRGKPQKR